MDGLLDLLLLPRSAGPCGPRRMDGLPDLLLLLRSAGSRGPAGRRRADGLPDLLLHVRGKRTQRRARASIDSLEEDDGVERRAAQRAPRRPLLPPRADGLDDAPPAEASVAAGPQLAVGRAREAHRARVPVRAAAAGFVA